MGQRDHQGQPDRPHEDSHLLKLYELFKGEEFHFLNAHHSRISFYSGFLSTLIAATIAGLLKASASWHYVVLFSSSGLILLVIGTAFSATWRPYQRFLEAVTMSAKIEEKLGLTTPPANPSGERYWYQTEPIVPKRLIESRTVLKRAFRKPKHLQTSEEFIAAHKRRGYRQWVITLLWGFLVCDLVLMATIVWRGVFVCE